MLDVRLRTRVFGAFEDPGRAQGVSACGTLCGKIARIHHARCLQLNWQDCRAALAAAYASGCALEEPQGSK